MIGLAHLPGSLIMPPSTKRQHVVDTITGRIRGGEYPPGSKLPSGSRMQAEFGCSAMTIRTAIDQLRHTGWVVGVPGAGVYVADQPPL